MAIADLNGDGMNDVVMTTSSYSSANDNSALVFFQTAQHSLDAPVVYSAGGAAQTVAVADFNGDGQKDIAVGKGSTGIRVFWNNQGDFSSYSDYATANAYKICTGDFNHDDLMDLAGIGWSGSQVDVFTQSKGGGLALAATYTASYGGYDDLKAGDVNADGWCDIIVMSGQTYAIPNVSVLLQTESGFVPAATYTVGPSQLTKTVAIGDINGDGRADLLATFGGNSPTSKLALFTQTPEGLLNLTTNYTSTDVPETVATGDLDMDGRLDAVVLHGGWRKAGIYLQNKSGGLAAEQIFTIPYASHYNTQGLAIGDINSDGRPDIVLVDYNNGLIVLYNASPAPNLRISAIQRLRHGPVTLSVPFFGPKGSSVVEGTDALGNWNDLGTVSDSTWSDPQPDSGAGRFYRLRAN